MTQDNENSTRTLADCAMRQLEPVRDVQGLMDLMDGVRRHGSSMTNSEILALMGMPDAALKRSKERLPDEALIAAFITAVGNSSACASFGWDQSSWDEELYVEAALAVGRGIEEVVDTLRADAIAETIRALLGIVTSDAEGKDDFIRRVRVILSEDPQARLSSIRARLEANLDDARRAGHKLAKQAYAAEQERDALAAKLAALEGKDAGPGGVLDDTPSTPSGRPQLPVLDIIPCHCFTPDARRLCRLQTKCVQAHAHSSTSEVAKTCETCAHASKHGFMQMSGTLIAPCACCDAFSAWEQAGHGD